MSLCDLCRGVGSWLLIDPDNDGEDDRYRRHPSWDDLEKSAKDGCSFCSHIINYFHDRGSFTSMSEYMIASILESKAGDADWITQISEQRELGEPTKVEIYKGADKIYLSCGNVGYMDENGLAVYVAPGDPAAYPVTRIRERCHISSDPLSKSTIDILRNWISECVHNHPDCFTLDECYIPKRLIDVGSLHQDPRLVEREDGLPERSVYITLSHCWGATQNVVTTSLTLNKHKSAIPFSSLNQTFKDAIQVVRQLGVQFLWIDSLCICQDSPSDWEAESAEMGSIYLNSLLTVAATEAADGAQGFLFSRRHPCPLSYHFENPVKGSINGTIWVAAWTPHFNDDFVNMSPLSRRGWVTQERLLPPRLLHFTKTKIMWECRTQVENEGDPETRLYKLIVPQLQQDNWYPSIQFARLLNRRLDSSDDISEISEIWHEIVNEYSHKSLTYVTDKLPAISGLAKQYERITDDKYYAGLWKRDFPYSLCWEASTPWKKPSTYLAPSWSWASFESGVSYTVPNKERNVFVRLLDASVTPCGRNPLGEISAGFLEVSGLLIQGHIKCIDKTCARVFLDNNEELGPLEVEVDDLPSSPWCLLLAERKKHTLKQRGRIEPEFLATTSVLLLEEATQEPNTFRRVGIVNKANPSLQWEAVDSRVFRII